MCSYHSTSLGAEFPLTLDQKSEEKEHGPCWQGYVCLVCAAQKGFKLSLRWQICPNEVPARTGRVPSPTIFHCEILIESCGSIPSCTEGFSMFVKRNIEGLGLNIKNTRGGGGGNPSPSFVSHWALENGSLDAFSKNLINRNTQRRSQATTPNAKLTQLFAFD